VWAAKFPASEEAGYSSFDVFRQVVGDRVLISAVFSALSVSSVVNAFQINTENTEATEKAKKVVARVFRPGDFLVQAAKFPASEEAGYSGFNILGKGNIHGPHRSYISAAY
jgi:hypothetical protein